MHHIYSNSNNPSMLESVATSTIRVPNTLNTLNGGMNQVYPGSTKVNKRFTFDQSYLPDRKALMRS